MSQTVDVTYRQLAVFDATLASPFSEWTDVHVAQGFAWRPGTVSFATLDDGAVSLEVRTSDRVDDTGSSASRIIEVPFTVPPSGAIEIASIADGISQRLPPGEHVLGFEHGVDEAGTMWAVLSFHPVGAPVPARVVRADHELDVPARLVMDARPA